MTRTKQVQAKHIPDADVLTIVARLVVASGYWTNTSAVADALPKYPFKVVAAKLAALLRRGLLTGCPCGCRGDWELTDAGRSLVTTG